MMTSTRSNVSTLIPVMLAFFAMGFVDMVGTATNYVKADFQLSDTMANFLPSMVFLWFFLLSIPTSLMMSRIGKKKTVTLSLVVTALSLVLPLCGYSYPVLLLSFCLLGIGNVLMQVSLNPLVSCIVSGDRLASTLTFGQFVKAIASFIAPLIASWATVKYGNWRLIYPVFLAFDLLAVVLLWTDRIEEEKSSSSNSSFIDCVKLLGDTSILLLFLGIVAHVGVDVGINTCSPKLIMEKLGHPIEKAGVATSVYFLFRTVGCLTGSFILSRCPLKKFFAFSVTLMALSMVGLFISRSLAGLYVAIALVGYGNSNIFSMIFSSALLYKPEKTNEISGLMIMGLIGGTIFPILMGVLSDALKTQAGSVIIISVGVVYLIYLFFKYFKKN